MTVPHRRWRLQLDLEADGFDGLVSALERLSLDMSLHPGAVHPERVMQSGGPDCGYTARITEDPSVTAGDYRAALETWVAKRRAARAADAA